jgi:rSAM/selenodomain-associated transferase 2
MEISVIIPALNESSNIERAIESVQFANEVVVADGGSTDGTVEIAANLGAKIVESQPGRGRQLKAGAERAHGDLLLFLHADNWLGAGVEQQLLSYAVGRSQLFGCFRQRIEADGFLFRMLEAGNAFRAHTQGLPYGDQAVFVDRTSYERVGGYADVPLMEDVILCRALRWQGRPGLLDGPVHLNARRWKADGVLRRTIRNWLILFAFRLGVSPERLVNWYA